VAAEEVEALPAFPEIHDPRLVRMELEPETGEDLPREIKGRLGLALGPAQDHGIVGIARQHSLARACQARSSRWRYRWR
jgi:hypothetical protein